MSVPPDPFGSVVITAKDIYEALIRLQETVNRLVEQSMGHTDDIRDHEARIREIEATQPSRRLSRLEEQVEALKAARWPLPSAAVLLSLAALVVTIIQIAN